MIWYTFKNVIEWNAIQTYFNIIVDCNLLQNTTLCNILETEVKLGIEISTIVHAQANLLSQNCSTRPKGIFLPKLEKLVINLLQSYNSKITIELISINSK